MATALAVTDDLIFSTKIVSTAASLGIPARTISTAEALKGALDSGGVRLVMVDMGLPGEEAVRAVALAAAHLTRPTVIAFFSHVHGALGEAARRAGATRVMPRSKFSEELPELLRAFGPGNGSEPRNASGNAGVNPATRPAGTSGAG